MHRPQLHNFITISIHAPTRGATDALQLYCRGHSNFNPRSHEGSDCKMAVCYLEPEIFQSTLPRGERRLENLLEEIEKEDFNPRSHEGSDVLQRVVFKCKIHFNPRSHEGSDFGAVVTRFTKAEFQSTLPRGERLINYKNVTQCHGFQSTLPRGERRFSTTSVSPIFTNFNPRSHEGSDCNID